MCVISDVFKRIHEGGGGGMEAHFLKRKSNDITAAEITIQGIQHITS